MVHLYYSESDVAPDGFTENLIQGSFILESKWTQNQNTQDLNIHLRVPTYQSESENSFSFDLCRSLM